MQQHRPGPSRILMAGDASALAPSAISTTPRQRSRFGQSMPPPSLEDVCFHLPLIHIKVPPRLLASRSGMPQGQHGG